MRVLKWRDLDIEGKTYGELQELHGILHDELYLRREEERVGEIERGSVDGEE